MRRRSPCAGKDADHKTGGPRFGLQPTQSTEGGQENRLGVWLHSSLSSIEGLQFAAHRSKTEQKYKKMLKMKVDPDELLKTKG
jgi:hypothetical protein